MVLRTRGNGLVFRSMAKVSLVPRATVQNTLAKLFRSGLVSPTTISIVLGISTQELEDYAVGRCKLRQEDRARLAALFAAYNAALKIINGETVRARIVATMANPSQSVEVPRQQGRELSAPSSIRD